MLIINGALIASIMVIVSILSFYFFTNFILWFFEMIFKVLFTIIEIIK